MSRILLFIPMYNCERQIGRVLRSVVPISRYFSEVLIIDNFSTDGSLDAAQVTIPLVRETKVTLIQNEKNYHFGGSHKLAFDYALSKGFDHVAILHGDDQADIQDLVPILAAGSYRDADIILGARFHPKATLIGYSRLRTYGNGIVNLFASLVTRRRIYDTGAGISIYARTALTDGAYRYFPDDLTFNAYHLFYALRCGFTVDFFPIHWREEDQVSNARVFRQGVQLLAMMWRYASTKNAWYLRTTPSTRGYRVIVEQSAR